MNRETLVRLSESTRGTFDVWRLMGPDCAPLRAVIMADLLGVPKVPQSKAGVTALRAALLAWSGVAGTCNADRDRNLREHCERLLTTV